MGNRALRDSYFIWTVALGTLLLSLATSAESQIPDQSKPLPPGVLVDVGGHRVHLYCIGQGTPTVMIVGAAFSFDWGLVQPQVAKFTRVCTFDPSGTAWSDPFKAAAAMSTTPSPGSAPQSTPTCADRVDEIHRLITKTPIEGPYVLVGFSVGALWERVFAAEYPGNIAGMVVVDHAFLPDVANPPPKQTVTPPSPQPSSQPGYTPPALLSKTPIIIGFEDDENFSKLPERDRELHAWALSRHPLRPGYEMAVDCFALVHRSEGKRADGERSEGERAYPLGEMPLEVISTPNQAPGYAELQSKLLALSHNSQQIVARNSSHMVPIDEPEVIIKAIQDVVENERKRVALPSPKPGQ